MPNGLMTACKRDGAHAHLGDKSVEVFCRYCGAPAKVKSSYQTVAEAVWRNKKLFRLRAPAERLQWVKK